MRKQAQASGGSINQPVGGENPVLASAADPTVVAQPASVQAEYFDTRLTREDKAVCRLVPIAAMVGHADAGCLGVELSPGLTGQQVQASVFWSDPDNTIDHEDINRRVVPLPAAGRPQFVAILGRIGAQRARPLALEAPIDPAFHAPLNGSRRGRFQLVLAGIAVGAEQHLIRCHQCGS